MIQVTDFKVRNHKVSFKLQGEEFAVNYPEGYSFGREYLDLMKNIPLCLLANYAAFAAEPREEIHADFEVSTAQRDFWMWVARQTALFDMHLGGEYTLEGSEWTDGQDNASLIAPPQLPEKEYEGVIISQSTGKESVASRILIDGKVDPIYSMFFEYPSRAATHKIAGREEFEDYFDNETIRVWSDANQLQSTLEEHTENYDPITQFWEQLYVSICAPLAVKHGLKYILLGNEIHSGEVGYISESDTAYIEELNQSHHFQVGFTQLLDRMGIPVELTSVVKPMTDFMCRKYLYRMEPDFMEHLQSCLRPTPDRRWCLRCYKCADAWIETISLGMDPQERLGLSHDTLVENPHLGGDRDDWGYEHAKYDRQEVIWTTHVVDVDLEHLKSELSDEQMEAYERWRQRQADRVDPDEMDYHRKFFDKYVVPLSKTIPDDLRINPWFEITNFCPDKYDPDLAHLNIGWSE